MFYKAFPLLFCCNVHTVKTSSHTRVCVHVEEVEPEEGGEKKASKRIVATWHPYGTAPDGTYALTK
jgi:hypothetical protein